jgi:sigma-E factor negative regulatory protein RseC
MIISGMLLPKACREEGNMGMERTGEVVEAHRGMLTVRFQRPQACENCRACDGKQHQHLVKLSGEARVGDTVVVSLPEERLAKASLLAYAVPLGGLLAGLFAGSLAGFGDVSALLGAALGLGLSLLVLRAGEKKFRRTGEWEPRLVSVEAKAPQE